MKTKQIITYSILILFALFTFYLEGVFGIFKFLLSISIYTLIFYSLQYLWKKLRKQEITSFKKFAEYFLSRISIFLLIITSIIGFGSYYLNEISPAPMPEFTLTNGTKIVKFQAMSHIGTENFYKTIVNNLTKYKNEGGVYFYEGVKPGTKENAEKFNKAIGITFDKDLYKNFSKLYGVSNQNNKDFMGLVNNLDFNVDLNMDEIMGLYDKKIAAKPEGEKEFKSKLPLDANKTIIDTLAELNERQLKILVYVNQAILNFIIGSESTQSFMTNNFTNTDLFDVILGKRNEVLSTAIIESEYEKMYITYGLLHFKGVLKLLKENDTKWKISSQINLYPIKK